MDAPEYRGQNKVKLKISVNYRKTIGVKKLSGSEKTIGVRT
jgi:hypothetical protein